MGIKQRGFYCDDYTWKLIQEAGAREVRSGSSIVATAVREYLARHHTDLAARLKHPPVLDKA